MMSPRELAACIADAGALIGAERDGVIVAASSVIREERRGVVRLSRGELRAALLAIGQMTGGNGRDFREWRMQTHGAYAEWKALLRAEAKLTAATR